MTHNGGFIAGGDSFEERNQALSDSVRLVCTNGAAGDIAEFGVARGYGAVVIALTMVACAPTTIKLGQPLKKLHLFDSFQGLPEATLPGDIDAPMVQSGVWGKGKNSSNSAAVVASMVGAHLPPDRYILYPGWFSETIPLIPKDVRFCLVNIDSVLYESAAAVLDDLFRNRRLSDGCVLLFSGYLSNRSSKKFGARRAWEECRAKYAPDFTDLGFYAMDGWRCIVHAKDGA